MKGERELKKHNLGEKLTVRQMIFAKCFECMGGYADGRNDCGVPECPLYPLMPYGTLKGKYKSRKVAYNPSLGAKRGIFGRNIGPEITKSEVISTEG